MLEIRAAFGDLAAYWTEASDDGITGRERENLLTAIDVLRDTVIRHSRHLHSDAVQTLQRRLASLRAKVARIAARPSARAKEGIVDALRIVEAILPVP